MNRIDICIYLLFWVVHPRKPVDKYESHEYTKITKSNRKSVRCLQVDESTYVDQS